MKKLLLLTCVIILSSCVNTYQNNLDKLFEDATEESYGIPPKNVYQTQIEQAIKASLKDPESAKFIWGKPYHCDFHSKDSYTTPILGWCVEVSYNAKNGFGGYVGYQTIELHYLNGEFYSVS